MTPISILIAHAAVTWFLVGLIWVIQIIHYPLFAKIPAAVFLDYERAHQTRITWVVAPAMLCEVVTASLLFVVTSQIPGWQLWLGIGLLAVIWLSTALLQMPAHQRLSKSFDLATIQRLVQSNWIRTIAWSVRGLLAGYWLSLNLTYIAAG